MTPFHHHTNDYHSQPQLPTHPHLDQAFGSDEGEGEWEDSVSSSRESSHSGSGQGVRYKNLDGEEDEGALPSLLNSRSSSSSVFKETLQDYREGAGRAGINIVGLQLGQGQSEHERQQRQEQQQQAGRSFKGCAMCRKSKVKCGEEKPGCGRCTRRGLEVSLEVSWPVIRGVFTHNQLVHWLVVQIHPEGSATYRQGPETSSTINRWVFYLSITPSKV
jgi:hypothetical protein